jgi:hypothetical protein
VPPSITTTATNDSIPHIVVAHDNTDDNDVPDLSAVHAQLKQLSGSRLARCFEPFASRFFALAERKPTLVYAIVALMAQIVAVVPIVTYLMLFRAIFFDGRALSDAAQVLGGLVCVILGLFCFMEGLNFALMPLGEVIGHHLRHRHVVWVLVFVCLLGLLVTLCEPAVNALQTLGDSVDPEKSVHLFFLVNRWGNLLLLFVGAGVGVASSLGTMRIRRRWSLKPLIYVFVVLALALSFVGVFAIPQLKTVVEIAWDCGGITTGLVSTAIIISFGIGSGGSESDSTIEGFGIVTLASLVPIIFVLLQSFLLVALYTDEEIAAVAAAHVAEMAEPLPLEAQSPYYEMIISVRSVAPLAFFLLVTLKVLLRASRCPRRSRCSTTSVASARCRRFSTRSTIECNQTTSSCSRHARITRTTLHCSTTTTTTPTTTMRKRLRRRPLPLFHWKMMLHHHHHHRRHRRRMRILVL